MNPKREKLDGLIRRLEEIWAGLDTLYENIQPDEWSTPHGDDWVFSDVPYHNYYCESELVARMIELGPDLPRDDQFEALNFAKLGAWNDEQFARRPSGRTVDQEIADLKAVQNKILALLSGFDDGDLSRPAWLITPFSAGWRNLEFLLKWDILHNWMEFIQLRDLMGRRQPEMSPETSRTILNGLMWFYTILLDEKKSKSSKFNFVNTVTGPAGGSWTVVVENGSAHVKQGRSGKVDLEMINSMETLGLVLLGKRDAGKEIQSGAIQVIHPENLPTFAALFPPPTPEKILKPLPLDVMI